MSLSSADVSHLESVLAQGKKPKVMFTDAAGQVAGRSGKVVALEDDRDGDFVVVAFGSDQLPFSAAELRLPARGEAARAKAPRQRSGPVAPPGPGLIETEPAASKPRRSEAASVERKPTGVNASEPAKTVEAPRKKAPRQRAAKTPELTVVLVYEDGAWSVSVARGSRTAVKARPIGHAAALAMCAAAASPEVDEQVAEVVERIRAETAEQAEALRKQLEEAEARLAELEPGA